MSKNVQSLDRALNVVEALASSRGGLGISELSRKLHLAPSTVHRLLATLDEKGYATQLHDGKYCLGHKVVELGGAYLENFQLRNIIRPHLEELVLSTGETANLVILESNEAFYLEKVDSPRTLRVFTRIGHRAPLYCTAAGKVLLANYSEKQLKRYLKSTALEPLTERTITLPSGLRQELEQVRGQGFASDLEECEEGASCVAVPLTAFGQRLVAALSLSGPTVRFKDRERERAVELLKETTAQVVGEIE